MVTGGDSGLRRAVAWLELELHPVPRLVRVDEEFAHGLRGGALVADQAEPGDLLGRKHILQEDEPVGLQ
jgi:hypothetical protein